MMNQETVKSICTALQNVEFNEHFIRCEFEYKYPTPDSEDKTFVTANLINEVGSICKSILKEIYLNYSINEIEEYICLFGTFDYQQKNGDWSCAFAGKYIWDTKNNQLCTVEGIKTIAPNVYDYMK